MATLTADLSVMIPGNGLTLLDELDLDPTLIEDMPQEDRDDPDGFVALSRGGAFILLEDTLYALLHHFTATLPAAVHAGENSVYKFQSAPSELSVTLEDDTAVLNHDGLKTISLPVSELLTVLDQIAEDAQQMEGILDLESA
tara:strand:+ start:84 stop:509 length:426 start_codon:yes stop_codon:yes gene_type:complete